MDLKNESSFFETASDNHITSGSKRTSISADSHEQTSSFGESSCGEPLFAQHLCIDFTPIEEIDNDVVQKKCVAFWDFINSIPEIQNLKVLPEPEEFNEVLASSDVLQKENRQEPVTEEVTPTKAPTAVSMLEYVEGKGLIDRTFEAKMPQSQCTLGSREYREGEVVTPVIKPVTKKEKSVTSLSKKAVENDSPAQPSKDVKSIFKTMSEWDDKHPKSMEPPGHPPALHHCVMQRKIRH